MGNISTLYYLLKDEELMRVTGLKQDIDFSLFDFNYNISYTIIRVCIQRNKNLQTNEIRFEHYYQDNLSVEENFKEITKRIKDYIVDELNYKDEAQRIRHKILYPES